MTPDEHIARLEQDAALLADAARRAGWDASVPGTEWDVRALVKHVGGVHRWAASVVRDAAESGDTPEGRAVGTGPDDAELLDWFTAGHAALIATLRAAPPDLQCLTFLPAASPHAFWARRQAHETAIHRADAQAAAGGVTPFDPGFAQDGIAELVLGFAARRSNSIDRSGVLGLRADDGPAWRLVFGGERIVVAPEEPRDADAVVAGTSSQLYLWVWNRPADVRISGDVTVADAWRSVRVRWS